MPVQVTRKSAVLVILFSLVLSACSPNRGGASPSPTARPNPSDISQRQLKLRPFELPSPSPILTSQPSPSPSCQSKIAVDLLLDTSSSMDHDINPDGSSTPNNRLQKMKQAVITFGNLLNDQDVIAVQEFNGSPPDGTAPYRVVVPPNTWTATKGIFATNINGLQAQGSTHTRDGFGIAQSELNTIRNQYPNHKRIMVFMSDGVPKSQGIDPADPNSFFPDLDQDPREAPNLAQAIKDSGVRVISIGLETDKILPQANIIYAQHLLSDVASSPQDAHVNATPEQLDALYREIAHSICR